MKKELKNKVSAELSEVYKDRENRDSGMPLFEGAVITLVLPENDTDPFFIKESNYYRWRTKGGEIVSTSQTGRRGNGLNLSGATDKERNEKLAELVADAKDGELQIRITKNKQKRAIFNGEETLNNYLFFELA